MLNSHFQLDFEFYSILTNSLWFYNGSDGLFLYGNHANYMYVFLENYNFYSQHIKNSQLHITISLKV